MKSVSMNKHGDEKQWEKKEDNELSLSVPKRRGEEERVTMYQKSSKKRYQEDWKGVQKGNFYPLSSTK